MQRVRDVEVPGVERAASLPRGTESLFEPKRADRVLAVRAKPDDLAKLGQRSCGLPNEARAITLYSSDERRNPR